VELGRKLARASGACDDSPVGPNSHHERDASPRDTWRSDARAHLSQRLPERMARCVAVAYSVSREVASGSSIHIGQWRFIGQQNRCSGYIVGKPAVIIGRLLRQIGSRQIVPHNRDKTLNGTVMFTQHQFADFIVALKTSSISRLVEQPVEE